MKKMLLTLFAAALTHLPNFLFAQSISGPLEVCPNTTVRYSWVGCSNGGSMTVTQAPGGATIITQQPFYMDVQFGDYFSEFPIKIQGSCSGAFPEITVRMKSNGILPPSTQPIDIPCEFRGSYTFTAYVSRYIDQPATVLNINTGWTLTNVEYSVPTDPSLASFVRLAKYTYNVTNGNGGQLKVTCKSQCGRPDVEKTYTINRTATPLPAPTFVTAPQLFCPGQSTSVEVNPYPNAVAYTWTTSNPNLLINGSPSPVTTTTTNVTLTTSGTSTYQASLSVTASTACVTTAALTRDVFVGLTGFSVLGADLLCAGDISFYWVDPIPSGVTYTWSAASGVITSGAGTFKVRVRFPVSGPGGAYVTIAKPGCASAYLSKDTEVMDCFAGNFNISPNPAKNNLNIELIIPPANAKTARLAKGPQTYIDEIKIVDKAGNVVKQQTVGNQSENLNIDISKLRPDVYIIQVRSGKEWKSKQFIVQ